MRVDCGESWKRNKIKNKNRRNYHEGEGEYIKLKWNTIAILRLNWTKECQLGSHLNEYKLKTPGKLAGFGFGWVFRITIVKCKMKQIMDCYYVEEIEIFEELVWKNCIWKEWNRTEKKEGFAKWNELWLYRLKLIGKI